MELIRKVKVDTNEIHVGDQLPICLKDFGNFTASAHKITDEGAIFLFDNIIATNSMNKLDTNKAGFDNSDMKKWLEDVVLPAFPENIQKNVVGVTLPTYGQIFGHDNFYDEIVEPDNDEQFELMENLKNRICDFDNLPSLYWLKNEMRSFVSPIYFAAVSSIGFPDRYDGLNSTGVRLEFILKKEIRS